jgi:hypothetical protein
LLNEATGPAPSCWTLRAVPEAVLPKTKQLDVFSTVGTVGANWLKLIESYYWVRFVSSGLKSTDAQPVMTSRLDFIKRFAQEPFV